MADGEDIIFEMGLYQAALPVRLRYSDIHFWFDTRTLDGRELTRCGLTSYAARLLADVFRLEWKVYVGQGLADAEHLGEIESTKANSELYSPMAGKLADINSSVVDDPSQIGIGPYDAWFLEFEGAPGASMNAAEYHKFLADGWEETQMMLKGQM